MPQLIICEQCGGLSLRTGPVQKYCWPCSNERDLCRKKLWDRRHPPSPSQRARGVERRRVRKELAKEAGSKASRALARGTVWCEADAPPLLWKVTADVPFSYAVSKNHIYTMRRTGHVALRREARVIRSDIIFAIKRALNGIRVVHNKVWIDILVQKPDHKGDAVNVVDLVCDAVKEAVGVDDRWFAIRRLDWEIVKNNPRLILGVGQDSTVDSQVCSYCGQIKPFSQFNQNKRNPLGIGRECRECRRHGRVLAKRDRPVIGSGSYDSPTAMEVVG